jgi:hypothetical protein
MEVRPVSASFTTGYGRKRGVVFSQVTWEKPGVKKGTQDHSHAGRIAHFSQFHSFMGTWQYGHPVRDTTVYKRLIVFCPSPGDLHLYGVLW